MSFSVGSGPIPQPDSTAAPPPVTPRTFRNHRRFIPSCISSPTPRLIVTHRAVSAEFAFHVTLDAPAHLQRLHLGDLGRPVYLAVAIGAGLRRVAQDLDVTHVGEVHEAGNPVHPDPLRGLPVAPRLAHFG